MKFAHISDVHIGAWRDGSLKALTVRAFDEAIDRCIERKLDFVLISGDLFNSALPGIEHLASAVSSLKRLKNAGIRTYVVSGSHDSNSAGSTIIDVLEEAELLVNVCKGDLSTGKLEFTLDASGAKLVGIGGRRGGLEKLDFEKLDRALLEREDGFKVFLFHAAISEMMPRDFAMMDSVSASKLPAGFDYYAGGHIHIVSVKDLPGRPKVAYAGPLFPASFDELWKLGKGGFFIYDQGKVERVELELKKVVKVELDADSRSVEELNRQLRSLEVECNESIVMIKAQGKLSSGRTSDVELRQFQARLMTKGAFFVMRSTSGLASVELDISRVATTGNVEDTLISANLTGKAPKEPEKELIKGLIEAFGQEQRDGERSADYQERIQTLISKLLF